MSQGGRGTWRRFRTIPNILKEFNSNLIGFSVGREILALQSGTDYLSNLGPYTEKGFNFGSSDATSKDLIGQARELVSALESDTRINMNRDWKLVTLSSGHRDLCHLSCKSGNTQQDFVENVKEALDILFTLPNIIIQVISPMGKYMEYNMK